MKLNERSKRLLEKENINIENFRSWNTANKNKSIKYQGSKLIIEEKVFYEAIYNPNDHIKESIKIYKKFLKK